MLNLWWGNDNKLTENSCLFMKPRGCSPRFKVQWGCDLQGKMNNNDSPECEQATHQKDHAESHKISPESTTEARQMTHESRSELVIPPLEEQEGTTSLTPSESTDMSLLAEAGSVCETASGEECGQDLAFSVDTIPEGMTARQWKIELRKKRREIRKEQAMYEYLYVVGFMKIARGGRGFQTL